MGLIEVLNLFKKSFCWLVEGDYTIEEVCKALPPYFYDFFEINLKTKPELLR